MRIVVIGAGHNCLVAAGHLAHAGHEVEIFERREVVGGACSTHYFDCGCYVNDGANALGMLHESVYDALGGTAPAVSVVDPAVVLPIPNRDPLGIFGDPEVTASLIAERTSDSRAAVSDYFEFLGETSRLTRDLWVDNHATFAQFSHALRPLGDLGAALTSGSLEGLLRRFFRDEASLALFATGNLLLPASPSDEGTAFALAYLACGGIRGIPGWGFVEGGMAKLATALARWSEVAGAHIHVETEVVGILLENGCVSGVKLANGDAIPADAVLSGADPLSTLRELVPQLPQLEKHRRTVEGRSREGGCAKINLLLDELPDVQRIVANLDLRAFPGQIVVCPTLAYLEAAFEDYHAGRSSTWPYCELTFAHGYDVGASCGNHIPVSVYLTYAPYERPAATAEQYREQVYEAMLRAVRAVLPDFARSVSWKEVLLPEDLEARYGMFRGNVDHGPMSPNNSFERRSVDETPAGATPVQGLFLCGGGIHPGGLISGMPGINATATVLEWAGAR